jgi:hypothetical protein
VLVGPGFRVARDVRGGTFGDRVDGPGDGVEGSSLVRPVPGLGKDSGGFDDLQEAADRWRGCSPD